MALFRGKKFMVSRTRSIAAPVEKIRSMITDFRQWDQWSPWLLHEPGAKIVYSGKPAAEQGWYEWDGKHIGAGKMKHLEFKENGNIRQEVSFIRPFKSRSAVNWKFEEDGENTRVTWEMEGEMPWYIGWMAKKMDKMVGPDYELGLEFLNSRLTEGDDKMSMKLLDGETLPKGTYLTREFKGKLSELKNFMDRAFGEIYADLGDRESKSGHPISIYYDVKPDKNYVHCRTGVPTDSIEGPEGDSLLEIGEIDNCAALELTGSYDHLPRAWRVLFVNVRMRKKKPAGKTCYELYLCPPQSSPKEQLTKLFIPLK